MSMPISRMASMASQMAEGLLRKMAGDRLRAEL